MGERLIPTWVIVLVVLVAIGLVGWLLYRFTTVHQPAVREQPPAFPSEPLARPPR